jgi:hypothetical protein
MGRFFMQRILEKSLENSREVYSAGTGKSLQKTFMVFEE